MAYLAVSALALASFFGVNLGHPLNLNKRAISWGPCQTNFSSEVPVECSTLEVPLDWTEKETSRTLNLDLLRVRATQQQSRGSILFNPGGPGGLGTAHVATQATNINRALQGHYDLIGFDTRGTGKTIPFWCNVSAIAEKEAKRSAHLPQRDLVEYLKDGGWHKAQLFADQCYEDNRDTGIYVSSAFISRDMLAIVEALEEDGLLRFWGASYGSILGQTFASMFPDKVDRMFLESIMDPADYLSGFWTRNLVDTDKSFDNFLRECLATPHLCRLANLTEATTIDQIKAAFSELLNEAYASQEMVTSGDHAFSWYTYITPPTLYEALKRSVFRSLYYVSNFPALDETLFQAISRNFTLFNAPVPPQEPDLATTLTSAGKDALWGISCSDAYVRASDVEEILPYVQQQQATSDFADGVSPQFWACPAWRFEPAERFTGPFGGATRSPILFANGPADPITPLSIANETSEAFVGSGFMRYNGHGHGAENHPSKCTDMVVRAYFLDLVLPEEGTVCEPNMPAFEWAYALAQEV